MNITRFGILSILTAIPAYAATDWNAATEAWRAQYRELAVVEAAHEACDLAIPKPVRRAMKEAREGLRDALSQFGPVESMRAVIKAAGGKDAFCADAKLMGDAKAAVSAFSAQAKEYGNKTRKDKAEKTKTEKADPPTTPSMSANAPTPVIDPNIALIRNCRQATLTKLGKKAKNNDAFWSTYEACMKEQGVGWF